LTAKQNSPIVGALQHPHHPKQGRLAGAVGTDDGQYFTAVNVEDGDLQCDVLAVVNGDVAQR
jgi:hypothetical protein